jgi:hypothetical protein
MIKKPTMLLAAVLLLGIVVWSFAQYTGTELEQKQGENLYPQPGPGELLIVDQLKETNRQLQEQTKLLSEQNRILIDTLEEMKKNETSNKTHPK